MFWTNCGLIKMSKDFVSIEVRTDHRRPIQNEIIDSDASENLKNLHGRSSG